MKPSTLFFVLVLLCLTIGCARAAPTPQGPPPPTATRIVYPATWTPVLTPTPLPPTPTQTPDANTVQVIKAFERTRGLNVYHAQMEVVAQDPTGSLQGAAPGEPFAMLSMEGRTNKDIQQFVLKGFILSLIGGDPERGIEFITVGDKVYLRGPFAYLGATQDRWYVSPRPKDSSLTDSANPQNVFADFGTAALPTMRVARAETLDGKNCSVYHGDERQSINYFVNLDPKGNLASALGRGNRQIEKGILSVTVCEDGYIHAMDLGLVFRVDGSIQTGSLNLQLRLNDMNIIVPIQEPQDAIPLPKPLPSTLQDNSGTVPRIVPTLYHIPTFRVSTVVFPTFPSD